MASVKSHTSPRGIAQQRYATDTDIARIYSISVKTLRKWRLFGRGPRYYRLGRAVRYDISEVDQYIRTTGGGGQAN
jgi:predicted DNA-binding transcriptional regulator AlpA